MLPVVLFICLWFFPGEASAASPTWQPLSCGIRQSDIRSISIFPEEGNLICASNPNSVYFSENNGRFWKKIFSSTATDQTVNYVTFSPADYKIIFLATTAGLYYTNDLGQSWRKIFSRPNELANNVHWISFDYSSPQSKKIYIGTSSGLYISKDLGVTWAKIGPGLDRFAIKSLMISSANPQLLYASGACGLFKSTDTGQTWEHIYRSGFCLNEDEDNQENQEGLSSAQLIEERFSPVSCLAITKDASQLYIATEKGVLVSADYGQTWQELPRAGLNSQSINSIVLLENQDNALYAATGNGVFQFLPKLALWRQVYSGLTANQVYCLAFNTCPGQLFAGTDKGIFKLEETNDSQNSPVEERDLRIITGKGKKSLRQETERLSRGEPTIREVQQAALKYAEVIDPARIHSLNKSARVKALLPSLDINYSKTVSVSTNPSYKEYVVGPYDWGLSLSWDVGDLVFSEQIRLLDSNTRLMLQLREDILNEVTRLYYERRRLQVEMSLNPPGTLQQSLNKELRLQELEANIDGLTGGYFTNWIQERSSDDYY